jgi:hypothetical protein
MPPYWRATFASSTSVAVSARLDGGFSSDVD